MIFIKEENTNSPDFFQLYLEKEELSQRDKMRGDETNGTGWNLKRRTKRDGTRRDKKVRNMGQDRTTFWSSRGALLHTIYALKRYSYSFLKDFQSRLVNIKTQNESKPCL
jgi:hypothetical protein